MEYRHYTHIPTEVLLAALIGAEETAARYQGELRPFFEVNGDASPTELTPLLAARELMRRWVAEGLKKRGEEFCSPVNVKQYLQLAFAGQGHESFVVLYLNTQMQLIEAEEPFRGTLTQTAVYPREIVKRALHWNAASVIFAHNHPSGEVEPSQADMQLTATLTKVLAVIDVTVLDHFVVAGSMVASFAERGLL